MKSITVMLCMTLFGIVNTQVWGDETTKLPPELLDLRTKHEKALAPLKTARTSGIKKAIKVYVSALEKFERTMSKKGNLDATLSIRAEIERAKEGQDTSKEDITKMSLKLKKLRMAYEKRLKPINAKYEKRAGIVFKKHIRRLDILERKLTALGDLNGAILIRKEKENAREDLEESGKGSQLEILRTRKELEPKILGDWIVTNKSGMVLSEMLIEKEGEESVYELTRIGGGPYAICGLYRLQKGTLVKVKRPGDAYWDLTWHYVGNKWKLRSGQYKNWTLTRPKKE